MNNKVYDILEQIEDTSSRTEKENILRDNKDNSDLQTLLFYTYNPYMIYGIGSKSFKEEKGNSQFKCAFDLLDYLLAHNTGTDKVKKEVNIFISNQNEQAQKWIKRVILKDLKIGISSTTINKIWKKYIPTFNVMLAKKYFDNPAKVKGEFVITQKLDGVRFLIVKLNGDIKFMSRQGKIFDGLLEIEKEAEQLPDNMVYDGELLAINVDNLPSKDLYRKTMKLATKDGKKIGLIHNCFDILPVEEFQQGQSKMNSIARKELLHNTLNKLKLEHIKEVPVLYKGTDTSMITKLLNEAIAKDQEGVMVNLDKPYACKRTDNILKVKAMQDCDCKVTGFEEGTGRLEGTLGAVWIDYKGFAVKVGSGYSDEDRKYIWSNKNKLLGKIMTVQYFEESTNQKDDSISLRFPVFLRWRFDKTEPSYN